MKDKRSIFNFRQSRRILGGGRRSTNLFWRSGERVEVNLGAKATIWCSANLVCGIETNARPWNFKFPESCKQTIIGSLDDSRNIHILPGSLSRWKLLLVVIPSRSVFYQVSIYNIDETSLHIFQRMIIERTTNALVLGIDVGTEYRCWVTTLGHNIRAQRWGTMLQDIAASGKRIKQRAKLANRKNLILIVGVSLQVRALSA